MAEESDEGQGVGLEEEEVCKAGAPEWIVTFGDMMSLLLTFFILLLSFANLEVIKYKILSGSIMKPSSRSRASSCSDDTPSRAVASMVKRPASRPSHHPALTALASGSSTTEPLARLLARHGIIVIVMPSDSSMQAPTP